MDKNKMVHDLNAPVNNLRMLLELLEKTEIPKDKISEHLNRIIFDLETIHKEVKNKLK